MNIHVIDTIAQYEQLIAKQGQQKEQYFRHTMMKPLEPMWPYLNVPLKAATPNGYDVLMATNMLGYLNIHQTDTIEQYVETLKSTNALALTRNSLAHCIALAKQHNLTINTNEIILGLYLADLEKSKLYGGYTGFGGIPGFITLNLVPTLETIARIPALIAHEFHHNIRFSHFAWNHGNVTVGDYIVIEGLAESFAKALYGEALLGPWVTSLDEEDLAYSIAVINDALQVKGFAEVSSYIYGDEIERAQCYQHVGLSYCAGYAVGYKVVQSFLKNEHKTIFEATFLSTEEILTGSRLFDSIN